jgi:alanyl-tRNA synthetase
MTGAEIRAAFLSYFEKHGHKVAPSSSLVPGNDPSLLFTNAGMVQFKEYFLGLATADWKRAATAQRCLRVSGKHNDLENVGYTARHHTLFEMLGNFSFGDYFKKDAIFFGWDFLTREMGIDGKRMTVSVFREDDEAYDIWHKTMGLPASRIVRLDEEDNFWAMGPTGPCGPCSEILYDQGEGTGCGRPTCAVGCDCDRFLEIWNLVFMQYNQEEDGARVPLPKPSIDTGMGLERLAAAVQGVPSNYDTDLFRRIIADIERLSGVEYGKSSPQDAATRVIADHSRATAFLIADGILPANEGRGYVLRRIMRRALRHGKKLGFDGPFLHQVAAAVVREFSSAYPELERSASYIDTVTLHEEKRFLETLDAGLRMVEEEFARIGKAGETVFAGSVAFKLYDTFGFPVDLTADLCREREVALDTAGFEAEMGRQRAQSREAWKGGELGVSDAATAELVRAGVSAEFVGYDRLEAGARVVALFRGGERVMAAGEGEDVDLVTDVTPFYGESGGQVGDSGDGTGGNFRLAISDAHRPRPDLVVHRAKVVEGKVGEGATVDLKVNSALRRRTQANHTATHLLQAALRKVLGDHVKQAGSYVGPDKLRFDFTHFEATPADALRAVEDHVNDAVFNDRPVSWEHLPFEEATAKGAMAFFGEKYADVVRMVTVSGVSRELCGGTHVRSTGEIALFRIVSEGALAAGVRRIEALTGPEAFHHLRDDADRVLQIAQDLRVSPADSVERVRKLQAQVRALEKDVQEARRRGARDLVGEVLAKARDVNGIRVVEAQVESMDPAGLRELADAIKGRLGSGLVLLGTMEEGRCHLVAGVTRDLASDYSATDIVRNAARFVGGGGGGRRDMAQAGGSNIEGFASALSSLSAWLAERSP